MICDVLVGTLNPTHSLTYYTAMNNIMYSVRTLYTVRLGGEFGPGYSSEFSLEPLNFAVE